MTSQHATNGTNPASRAGADRCIDQNADDCRGSSHAAIDAAATPRAPLTASNLVAHNASTTTAGGPTPMQRWYASTDDITLRGRTMQRRGEDNIQDETAAEIERILQRAAAEGNMTR